jgi:chromosome segregation ATPase
VEPAADPRRQLGQIMVDEGFLTESQLLDALAEHNRTGTPLGKVLVDLGFVSPGAVANALAEQHGGLLRTEYGTSAGLREMAGRAPIRTDAQPTLPVAAAAPPPTPLPAAPPAPAPALGSGLRLAGAVAEAPADAPPPPAPVSAEPAAVALEPHVAPEPADVVAPEPEPAPFSEAAPAPQVDTARIDELESKLHAVLTERNSLVQSFNELQARLSEAAQAHEAGVAAEVQERMGALESQLQAAAAQREELERAHQQAAERVAELEARLNEDAEGRHELDNELERLRTGAADRDAAFEQLSAVQAELEELRSRPAEDTSGQLDELARQRAAAEERARALEHDLGQLREQAESLRVELEAVREQVPADDALAQKVSALEEALQALTAERDAAVAHSAELEPELAQLREQASRQDDGLAEKISGLEEAIQALTAERDHALARLRDAATPFAGSTAEVEELRRQLAARDRRLAESVGEIAKMSREHRALLQLVERQFQLEETTTSLPEPKSEAAHVLFVPAASGYTLVEREGVAPEAGDLVDLDGGRYVVRRHGPSPLPGPRRRCAYLERA